MSGTAIFPPITCSLIYIVNDQKLQLSPGHCSQSVLDWKFQPLAFNKFCGQFFLKWIMSDIELPISLDVYSGGALRLPTLRVDTTIRGISSCFIRDIHIYLRLLRVFSSTSTIKFDFGMCAVFPESFAKFHIC